MSKIADYLNEHLLGEVSSSRAVRKRYAFDSSILSFIPEVVAFPRVTNDIRKVARFTWQLAEKGHVIGITTRGLGGDTTGAAVGKGIIVNTANHLNKIIQVVPKQRLVHVQPGVRLSTLQEALKWQGLALPNAGSNDPTIGGAIAGDYHGSAGAISDAIEKLEVVLANGDLLETTKLSKRELSKKLGLQTFEGEIYRKLEGLIEDNQDLINKLAADPTHDNVGYKRLAQVRGKDGSFDLTPLFIGSQGTLGIISEAVLRSEFYSRDETHVVITTDSVATARDVAEQLQDLMPAEMTIYDGELFRRAVKEGVSFSLLGDVEQLGAALYVSFGDFNNRTQSHKVKKLRKILKKTPVGIIDSSEHSPEDFLAVRQVGDTIAFSDGDSAVVPLIDGAFIPLDRREAFEAAFDELATKHHLKLPLIINTILGTYSTFPQLKLDVVSDKQKLFRLIADYAQLVDSFNGAFVSDGAEGRLKANAAWSTITDEEAKLYDELRTIFDPFGTLNPDVKQRNEIRTLVASLRSSYDPTDRLL